MALHSYTRALLDYADD